MRQDLCLLKNRLRCFYLLVGRVAILAQDALDHDVQLGANEFADRPVDGDVFSDDRHQLAGDGLLNDVNRRRNHGIPWRRTSASLK